MKQLLALVVPRRHACDRFSESHRVCDERIPIRAKGIDSLPRLAGRGATACGGEWRDGEVGVVRRKVGNLGVATEASRDQALS